MAVLDSGGCHQGGDVDNTGRLVHGGTICLLDSGLLLWVEEVEMILIE